MTQTHRKPKPRKLTESSSWLICFQPSSTSQVYRKFSLVKIQPITKTKTSRAQKARVCFDKWDRWATRVRPLKKRSVNFPDLDRVQRNRQTVTNPNCAKSKSWVIASAPGDFATQHGSNTTTRSLSEVSEAKLIERLGAKWTDINGCLQIGERFTVKSCTIILSTSMKISIWRIASASKELRTSWEIAWCKSFHDEYSKSVEAFIGSTLSSIDKGSARTESHDLLRTNPIGCLFAINYVHTIKASINLKLDNLSQWKCLMEI